MTSTEEPLNIIVPIGGLGTRFAKQGYRFPKPLINIIGRPMLLWLFDNLSIRSQDTLWIAVNEHIEYEFRIGQLVAKSLPKTDLRLLQLRHQTKGASETLYMVLRSMGPEHLDRRTVSLDCDTIYWTDVLQRVREMPTGHGACFYFTDTGNKPIFSYIKTEEEQSGQEIIKAIAEKLAISNKANTGAYVFPSARVLRDWCATSLDERKDPALGEYFTSQVITMMLEQVGLPFLGIEISHLDFSCVGTPEQLEDLLIKLKAQGLGQMKKRRFCFDLDMTLVGVPLVPGDYSTCPPIDRNIRLVQQLYEAGHYIIIQTARRMRTHHGNVGSVLADVGPVTFAQLDRYKIPYHDIHFGKPYADAYVDDLAINSNMDTMRELGWLLTDSLEPKPSVEETGMVAARDFNTVQAVGGKVIKSSKSENILGELFFYSHLPPSLQNVFPSVYHVDYLEKTGTYSITMENIKGTTFSHLLVGRSITSGRLVLLLDALHKIHHTETSTKDGLTPMLDISTSLASKFHVHSLARADHCVNVYANYATKLQQRYSANRERYDALGPLSDSIYNRLTEFLDTYEAEDKGAHAHVIHGDPVFSNAILTQDSRQVRFIDIRCQLDNTLTPEGDIHYDLAKVLQSLCGYDHIMFLLADSERNHTSRERLNALCADSRQIVDEASQQSNGEHLKVHKSSGPTAAPARLSILDEADSALLDDLRTQFFSFIKERYSVTIHPKTLLRITASLLFTLLPLHRPELGPIFLRMCNDTLAMAASIRAGSLVQSRSSSCVREQA
jgi:capsule biosynthesis phosphatase